MTRKRLAALAATMAFALPASAMAGSTETNVVVVDHSGTETRSITVSVADLNLASAHGARLADNRIARAAKQVCGWMSGTVLQPTREYRSCFTAALDGARGDLGTLIQAQRQG